MTAAERSEGGKRLYKTAHSLEVLATSTNIQESRSALQFAVASLANSNTPVNDVTATTAGITLVLRCFQKYYYSYSCPTSMLITDHTQEERLQMVALYVQLLTMMFRCSNAIAVQSFEKIGTDLVSLLISLLCDNALPNTHVIFALINRLAQLQDVPLSKVHQKEALVRLLQRVIRGEYEPHCPRGVGLQWLGAWVEHPDSKRFILNHTGLLDDVLAMVTSADCCDGEELFHIAIFLWRITWDTQRKPELVHKTGLLKIVLFLLNLGNIEACRAASNTLAQLATEASCRIAICKHDKGAILTALIEKLETPALCAVVNQTLLRLICQDTASYMLKKLPTIIDRLAQCAQAGANHSNDSVEASILAAQCLKRLSSFVVVCNKAHPNLINALTTLSGAESTKIRFWAAKGLCEQTKSSTGRFYIARDPSILSLMIRLAKDDTSNAIKSFATDALLTLASDTANVKRLASSSDVLECFVGNAKMAASSRSSIEGILSLASHRAANQQRVAKTRGLVATLSEYSVSNESNDFEDESLKRAALHCVMNLAPLM